jgi:hypothetical protein
MADQQQDVSDVRVNRKECNDGVNHQTDRPAMVAMELHKCTIHCEKHASVTQCRMGFPKRNGLVSTAGAKQPTRESISVVDEDDDDSLPTLVDANVYEAEHDLRMRVGTPAGGAAVSGGSHQQE